MNDPNPINPPGSKSAATMIAAVEAYFDCADRHDINGTVAAMTDDCLLEFRSLGIVRKGRDPAIRQFFEERRTKVIESWHGDFEHTIDVENARIATRFALRRLEQGRTEHRGDNLNLFQFSGARIARISVWSGEARTAEAR